MNKSIYYMFEAGIQISISYLYQGYQGTPGLAMWRMTDRTPNRYKDPILLPGACSEVAFSRYCMVNTCISHIACAVTYGVL